MAGGPKAGSPDRTAREAESREAGRETKKKEGGICPPRRQRMRDQLQRRGKRRRRNRRGRLSALLAVIAGLAMAGWGAAGVARYVRDLAASRNTAAELREIYDSGAEREAAEAAEPETEAAKNAGADAEGGAGENAGAEAERGARENAEAEAEAAEEAAERTPEQPGEAAEHAADGTAEPEAEAAGELPREGYPGNPKLRIRSRFRELRKEGRDIVGWLTLDRLLDEPVVQRDHLYYLNHDALGGENVNGALFLDAGIRLDIRPRAYLIYGHNMKIGAMFGRLRNYENIAYYRREPFLTFDTLYEEGRFVIFAVGSVSTGEGSGNYVDFFGLKSDGIREREAALEALVSASVYTCPLDVRPEDQLLVLVTCVEKEEERRVVAARRIREDETEAELKKLVEKSRKKP